MRGLVVPGPGGAAQLELTLLAVGTRDDAVDEQSRVAAEVRCLARAEHHRQPEVAVEDERLDRAQSRCPVLADRYHEQDTWTDEPVLRDPAQAGLLVLQLLPSHAPCLRQGSDSGRHDR